MPLPDHTGETCIIMGNGPSLKSAPLEWLGRYPTFGSNFVQLCTPHQPDYYVCVDGPLLMTRAAEIHDVASAAKLCFISAYPPPNPALDRLRALPNHIGVGKDTLVFATELYMSGNTCTYVALKAAFFMGFARVLLIGVDHSEGREHASPDYPAARAPNYSGQEYHYALAAGIYAENGREIINLSNYSSLSAIFRQGTLSDYL